jgi:serine O-acetyltransferase
MTTKTQDLLFKLQQAQQAASTQVPDNAAVAQWTEAMYGFLFPVAHAAQSSSIFDCYTDVSQQLTDTLLRTLVPQAKQISEAFFDQLGQVYELLQADLDAFVQSDPAATGQTEVIVTYPGFFAVVTHRLAHLLHSLEVPLLPRMCAEYAHSKTGIDIHPAAQIGKAFFIDHGTGVVIGETSIVGHYVRIYQGVTLGALHVDKALAATKRHPTIGDHVVIYANATILGGKTTIGHHSVIGGNTWLTKSVEPYSVVQHTSEVQIRPKYMANPEIHFII